MEKFSMETNGGSMDDQWRITTGKNAGLFQLQIINYELRNAISTQSITNCETAVNGGNSRYPHRTLGGAFGNSETFTEPSAGLSGTPKPSPSAQCPFRETPPPAAIKNYEL
ncbi:MAG: hypothetical protein LBR10_01755 [Prevotellaceae bacterium]|jgi:hypothetical protein|nr:hypothetical protein [Prevotellaceae bacterium]